VLAGFLIREEVRWSGIVIQMTLLTELSQKSSAHWRWRSKHTQSGSVTKLLMKMWMKLPPVVGITPCHTEVGEMETPQITRGFQITQITLSSQDSTLW
jgi:hypothetical protein